MPDLEATRWRRRAAGAWERVLGPTTGVLIAASVIGSAHGLRQWVWTIAAAATCGAAIVVCRRRPLAALIAATLALVLTHLAGGKADSQDVSLLAQMILTYAVGAYAPRREAVIGLTVSVAAAMVLQALAPPFDPAPPLVLILPAFFVGRALRRWRLLTVALDEHSAALEASREAHTALAVREERARIARELHDVIGHGVSLMVVQATAGHRIGAVDPSRANDALDAIDDAGTQALAELSRLAGLLDAPRAARGRSITELVDSARRAGLEVHLRGDHRDALDPLAFRILQEALTNVLKHAAPTSVEVSVTRDEDALRLRVTNQGRAGYGDSLAAQARGHGLTGMRERVALAGGTLTAGPTDHGGWEVSARLPAPRPVAAGSGPRRS